jgi:hypothetical protein
MLFLNNLMPQFITANKRREAPVAQAPGFPYTGTARRTLEEQAAAAKKVHPNLSGGMLTMANKHQADKEISAAQNEAYWLNQASLQGVEFKPGQEHWTDPMDRFIFGSPEPGSAPIAPMDYAGGGASLLKLGAKAGAAALGGLMMRNFIKNPPEPGTLFSIFGTGSKAPKLKGGKLNLRFVADKTKGTGFNTFGWGIYFSESRVTSGGYAKLRTWNIDKFINPLQRELEALAVKRMEFERAWKGYAARHRVSINIGHANPNFLKEQKSINVGMHRALDLNKKNSARITLLDEKVRTVRSINRSSPEDWVKMVDENPDLFDPEIKRWMKDDVIPNLEKTGGGSHWKVDIADEVIGERGGKLMDWFVPLKDHPADVQKKIIEAIRSVTVSKSGKHIPDSEILSMWGHKEGGQLYNDLSQQFRKLNSWKPRNRYNSDKVTSEALRKAGIFGTRFQGGTLTLNNADIVKTWAKPDNINMNLVIWDQKILNDMKYLGEF